MATKTITIKESAYKTLAACKQGGESFSDVIEREFSYRIETGADLLALVGLRRKQGRGLGFAQRKRRQKSAA
jgi:predicted CopG family antitoxin